MTRLLRVELTRLRWRRSVLVLVVLAILMPVVLLVAVAWHTRPVSDSEQQAVASQRIVQRQITSCEKRPQRLGLDSPDGCRATVLGYYSDRQPLDAADQLRNGSMVEAVTLVALLMLLAGTTFAGHDWTSGSMSNQLLFDPRRARVWLAKAMAVTLLTVVVSAVVLLALWTATYGLAHHRGLPTSPGLLGDGLEQVGRSVVLCAALALGAYALTMLLRSTVGTIGVAFGVAVVGSLLIAVVGGEGATRWQPAVNVGAFVTNAYSYYSEDGPCGGNGATCSSEHILTAGPAAIHLGVALAVVVLASLLSYRRRDVP